MVSIMIAVEDRDMKELVDIVRKGTEKVDMGID